MKYGWQKEEDCWENTLGAEKRSSEGEWSVIRSEPAQCVPCLSDYISRILLMGVALQHYN